MTGHTRKLMTIITEGILEAAVVRDVERLGAHGYTVVDARGKGAEGARNADWEASRNIRIEVVCDAETADAIASHLLEHYYEDYAMVLWATDIAVLRPEKFDKG